MIKINGEPCERVASFDELRTGTIVWIKPCGWCGSRHRLLLLNITRAEGTYPNGRVDNIPGFKTMPKACRARPLVIAGVKETPVYRVIDPLLNTKSKSRSKELAK